MPLALPVFLAELALRQTFSSAIGAATTVSSLGQAIRQSDRVNKLDLRRSPDLLCVNLLCEKVGDPCICRLSRVFEKLPNLTDLDLSDNQLVSLPDSIGTLKKLQRLNLNQNKLSSLPASIQQLKALKV